jgi:hypothetical protein
MENEFSKLAEEVREAHLRAFLKGETLITPLELRAVVRAALKARESGYRSRK